MPTSASPPPLPDGDLLYTPGDLGLSREEHTLLLRCLELTARCRPALEYRYWGSVPDAAAVAFDSAGQGFRQAVLESAAAETGGWEQQRFTAERVGPGFIRMKLTVPAEAVSPDSPYFYDGFRIVAGGKTLWRGDARSNRPGWYNTGFSIFSRSVKRYYRGIGVSAAGIDDVRLVNVTATGFFTGLSLSGCAGWTIDGNDFSDCYDDPDYGWGDGTERFGGIHLDHVSGSLVTRNRACRVWNGLVLRRCTGFRVEDNSITHCSNTCLKLSRSSNNTITGNNFSWGLRKYPEEVHARDSVSLLVESGSDGNRFSRNDFSHGEDGIFIRVLNGWCSSGNLFEENDCSDANNNAVEAWSPGNTYIGNKANRSSYGFWLGGSDDTVLIGNEVMDNGEDHANAPEPFGNAGIAVVHGSSTGFIIQGNRISGNNGPGIALGYRGGARPFVLSCHALRRPVPRGARP